ncbi:BQ2448_1592 [Microbotryum intermedium]|uniref:BQ2448_1592 protein n=1 Tax=Microbotryum intermedium TaxID=269621 RepID=A0A238FGB8_9BASI|nr:BQ2448_1592 [Microbotryum intermedium]
MMPRRLLDKNESSLMRLLEDVELGDKCYRKRTERLPSMLEWTQVMGMNRKPKTSGSKATQDIKPDAGRDQSLIGVPAAEAEDAADVSNDAPLVAPEEAALAWHPPPPSSIPHPDPDTPPARDEEQIPPYSIVAAARTEPLSPHLNISNKLIGVFDDGVRCLLSDVARDGPRRRRQTERPPGMVGWKQSRTKRPGTASSTSTAVASVEGPSVVFTAAAAATKQSKGSNKTAPQTPPQTDDLPAPDSSQARDEAEFTRLIEELKSGPEGGEELRQRTERLHELAGAIVQRRRDHTIRRRRSDNYFEGAWIEEVKAEKMENGLENEATEGEDDDEEGVEPCSRLAWASPAKTGAPRITTWVKSAFDRLHWLGERVQVGNSTGDARLRQISADLGEGSE